MYNYINETFVLFMPLTFILLGERLKEPLAADHVFFFSLNSRREEETEPLKGRAALRCNWTVPI